MARLSVRITNSTADTAPTVNPAINKDIMDDDIVPSEHRTSNFTNFLYR